MIRHVVAFRLVSSGQAEADRDAGAVRAALVPLAGTVPHVTRLEVGRDLGAVPGHWDLVLVSEHESADELAAYQVHPAHTAAVAQINPLIADRAVVDYESV